MAIDFFFLLKREMLAGQNNKIKERRQCAVICVAGISAFALITPGNLQARAWRPILSAWVTSGCLAQSRTQDTNQTCHRQGTGKVFIWQVCSRV